MHIPRNTVGKSKTNRILKSEGGGEPDDLQRSNGQKLKLIPSLSTADGRRQCDNVFKGLGITSTLLKTLYVSAGTQSEGNLKHFQIHKVLC